MTAQVSNAALVGATPRVARSIASTRRQIDGLDGAQATPSRDQASWTQDSFTPPYEPGNRPRRGEFRDSVISFGGVLVSLEVGSTIVEAQSANALYPPVAAEAERQIANYEFAQSLAGPAEAMAIKRPFN